MQVFNAQMEKSGRILIPAPLRRQLQLTEGAKVILKLDELGVLQLETRRQALERAQRMLRKYIPEGSNLVDEFIADRRAEVRREARREAAELRAAKTRLRASAKK